MSSSQQLVEHECCGHLPVTEGAALCLDMKLGRDCNLPNVIVESNYEILVNRLSKSAIFFFDLDMILEDDLFLSKYLLSIRWPHVLQDGNCVAHHIARVVPFGFEQCSEFHCPMKMAPYILMDSLSMN